MYKSSFEILEKQSGKVWFYVHKYIVPHFLVCVWEDILYSPYCTHGRCLDISTGVNEFCINPYCPVSVQSFLTLAALIPPLVLLWSSFGPYLVLVWCSFGPSLVVLPCLLLFWECRHLEMLLLRIVSIAAHVLYVWYARNVWLISAQSVTFEASQIVPWGQVAWCMYSVCLCT
jgi:hypothetical protein